MPCALDESGAIRHWILPRDVCLPGVRERGVLYDFAHQDDDAQVRASSFTSFIGLTQPTLCLTCGSTAESAPYEMRCTSLSEFTIAYQPAGLQ